MERRSTARAMSGPMAGRATDILIDDGRIARIGAELAAPAGATSDGGGAIALPGLVEAHTHLDKTLWGMPWYKQRGRPAADRQDRQRARLQEGGSTSIPARQSARQIVQSLADGLDPYPQPCRRRHRARPCGHRRRDGDARALSRHRSTSRSSPSRNPACWPPGTLELHGSRR